MKQQEIICIKTETIQLDQLLKLANVVVSGGQVRFLLEEQAVFVNDEVCTAKRKQLRHGDIVTVKGAGTYKIVGV